MILRNKAMGMMNRLPHFCETKPTRSGASVRSERCRYVRDRRTGGAWHSPPRVPPLSTGSGSLMA